jgi:hypothetical protein
MFLSFIAYGLNCEQRCLLISRPSFMGLSYVESTKWRWTYLDVAGTCQSRTDELHHEEYDRTTMCIAACLCLFRLQSSELSVRVFLDLSNSYIPERLMQVGIECTCVQSYVFIRCIFQLKSTLEPGQPQHARSTADVTAQQCLCTRIASLRVHYQKGKKKGKK